MVTRTSDTEALVRYVVTALVDEPDSVSVARRDSTDGVAYEISVHPDDVGKVIGRQGRIIKALRTLARAAGSVDGTRVDVDVLG